MIKSLSLLTAAVLLAVLALTVPAFSQDNSQEISQINSQDEPRVQIEELAEGDGPVVTEHAGVMIHYNGMLADGTQFDTTMKSAKPFQFRVGDGRVIKGLELGVIGMRPGGQRRIVIPPELAYGEEGAPPKVPSNATLTFEVMMVRVFPRRYVNIGVAELRKLLAEGTSVVDLRSEKEWRSTGTIPGSYRLTAVDEKGKLNIRFLAWLKKVCPPDEKVVLVDWDGFLSTKMSNMISNYGGYTQVFNLEPGLKGWIATGGEMER